MPATPGAARAPASNRLRTSPASGRRACPGFGAAADLDAIRGQCVGSEPVEGDGEPLDEKIGRLTAGIGG
jgi:hypothetical protein